MNAETLMRVFIVIEILMWYIMGVLAIIGGDGFKGAVGVSFGLIFMLLLGIMREQ